MDHYKTLGVLQTATLKEITRAYRKIALQVHPDRNKECEEWANQEFKKIGTAYGILKNPDSRSKRDGLN